MNLSGRCLRIYIIPILFWISIIQIGCAAIKPTATVIDDETGKPVEGAVALAIWREVSTEAAAWFEGGKDVPVRIEEVLTDKNGDIFIKGFWNWHLLEREYPRLTVYKFGYVCWDQKLIFAPDYKWIPRQDFNKENRVVKLKKWPVGFSFREHASFEGTVTSGNSMLSTTPLFYKALRSEGPYISKELDELYLLKKK
jgi:hypothetical protein